jgi:hypothetical protein
MNRRQVLGGLGAIGLLAANESGAAAQHPHHHDKDHGDCLKACDECSRVCSETLHYALEHLKDGHTDHAKALEMTMDCQEFCNLSAELMSRESSLMGLACAACAAACAACAQECKKHDDDQMRECVKACQNCEKACLAMADHMKNHEHHA